MNGSSLRPASRLLLAALVTSALVPACGGRSTRGGSSVEPRPWTPAEATPTAASPRDEPAAPEQDLLGTWARAAPGHESARVTRIEPAGEYPDGWEGRPSSHVVVEDGDEVLDAWVVSTPLPHAASSYWRVAELVSITRAAEIDALQRGDGWTLWTIRGSSMICPDSGGACRALPPHRRAHSFFCNERFRSCTLSTETDDGRTTEWMLRVRRDALDQRPERSWPTVTPRLEGRWDAGARAERGRWEALAQAPRPAIVDDARLAAPGASAGSDDGCRPTVRSFRDDHLVVRTVSCGEVSPWSDESWPVAFVVAHAGHSTAAPLFVPSPGPPDPERGFPIRDLAGDAAALAFVASAHDGGSPSGGWRADLWVLLPATGARGPRLHRLEIAGGGSEGLGTHDDRDGYVVAIDHTRAAFEVVGPGLGRFTGCERWSGTHTRISDRWAGRRRTASLDLRVSFDVDGGFEISDDDIELFDARCRRD